MVVILNLHDRVAGVVVDGVSDVLVLQSSQISAALQVADYGYVLETGDVVLQGPASDLAHNPRVIESYLGLGGALGVYALYLRRKLDETPMFKARQAAAQASGKTARPGARVFWAEVWKYRSACLRVFALSAGGTVLYYVWAIMAPTFAITYRYLKELCNSGLLIRSPEGYAPGPRFIEMDLLIREFDPLVSRCRPLLRSLLGWRFSARGCPAGSS
ncbi:branched-chain amino acid ABC transporter ATP-binding protein, partial [Alcaligenes faecalis subsp. faecalis NCIB 8687]